MAFLDSASEPAMPPDGEGVPADQPSEAANGLAAPAVAPDLMVLRKLERWADPGASLNIATEIDKTELDKLGQRVKEEYTIDETSRTDWLGKSKAAMDLAMQVAKEKDYPWPKSSNIVYPAMTSAALQFHARAYPAVIAGRSVVKGVVSGTDEGTPLIGLDGTPVVQMGPPPAPGMPPQPMPVWREQPGAKKARATRIGEHMSWQLLEEQPEWEEETDKLLIILPIAGCVFRKSYFDSGEGRNASLMVTAQNLVINYYAKSIERAPRLTEELKFYPVEIEENERSDIFIKPETPYGVAPDGRGDRDAPHEFLEQHRFWDLDGDGYPEPYIVTVYKPTAKVVRIVARYDHDGIMLRGTKLSRIKPVHYYTKYDFLPNPEGGIYGVGFGQLLSPINEAVNTTLNMLFDSGHQQVAGGGFIGKQLSMHAGNVRFRPGEYKTLNVPGAAIKDAIVPLQFAGPSAVMFSLLGMLIDAGKEISMSKDVLTGDLASANMQPTTLFGLIEQGLNVFSGIYKRVHRSLKQEYEKLYRLNRIYLEEQASYRVGDEWKQVTRADYAQGSGVDPVSDPKMVSDMQRMAKAQFLLGFKQDPGMDPLAINKRALEAGQIENPEELFAPPQPQPPPDPMLALAVEQTRQNGIKTQAAAVADMAKAALSLAQADKAMGDKQLAWINARLDFLKAEVEGINVERASGPAAGTNGAGNNGTGVPALAAPSGDQDAAGVPQGLPGGVAA